MLIRKKVQNSIMEAVSNWSEGFLLLTIFAKKLPRRCSTDL